MTWLVSYLALDPTLSGPTTTLLTACGKLFALGCAVGGIYYLFVARKLSKAVMFGVLAAICAIFVFSASAIQEVGDGIKTLLGL